MGAGEEPGPRMRWLGAAMRARVAILVLALLAALIALSGSKAAFLLGVLVIVAALAISVMLHEFGHFVTAKKFGMQVTQFFLGFGATLWSTRRGETEYGVKALPFGGFVRITGMTSMEEVDVADEPRSFRNQPGWQRMIVMVAGSFMHFVLALFLLFALALAVGLPQNTNVISAITTCVPATNAALTSPNPCSGGGLGRSPAAISGIRAGDQIISVGGKRVGNWNQLVTVLDSQHAGVKLPLTVRRDGRDVPLTVTLAAIPKRSVPYLGVEPQTAYVRRSVLGAVTFAGNEFASAITSSVSAIGKLPAAIPDLFAHNRARTPAGDVTSVVGVAQVTGDVTAASLPWQYKLYVVLFLIAALNVFFGAFNLLPLLPLDGGHLAVVIFERARAGVYRLLRRPDPGLVDMTRLVPVSLLVFAVLVGVGTLLIAADLFNPIHVQV